MKVFLIALLIFVSIKSYSQHKVDVDQLISETQIGNSDPDAMSLVWWIPIEFWIASMENDESVSRGELEEIITALEPYSMFAVVDGVIGPFGGVTYSHFDDIEKSLELTNNDLKTYQPIDFDNLNADAQALISVFKPLLKNMLGEMGENMHFFVFNDLDGNRDRICDPKSPGKVTLNVMDETYSWKTPLGSLLVPKKCPEDAEEMNGSWMFCPWHGEKLIDREE